MSGEALFAEGGAENFLKDFDFIKNEGTYKIKFLDFGMSETVNDDGFGSTSRSGTPVYSSPE